MGHSHTAYDGDAHFKIDPVTRQISNESGKVVLMQNDHKSEILTFDVPRFVDGHDMSLCDKVEVHFNNTCTKTRSVSRSHDTVTDLAVAQDDENMVVFSWSPTQRATQYAGTLSFAVRFACTTDGEVDYQWSTEAYKEIKVSESINNEETVVKEYANGVGTIVRGTTPTHTFTIPFDTASLLAARITYAQDGVEVFSVETEDCTMNGQEIAATLKQEDTLKLAYNKEVKIQLHLLTNLGVSLKSDVYIASVGESLSDEVLE